MKKLKGLLLKMQEKEKIVEKLVKELLDYLGIAANAIVSSEAPDTLRVNLESADPGLVIGYHGETLRAFQTILGVILFRKLGTWTRIIVDVGTYREEREMKLRELAKRNAERARFLAKSVMLPPMPPEDRRLVHLAVSEIEGVFSESVGEGLQRRVVVKPKEGAQDTA